jgi:hypothetical protein
VVDEDALLDAVFPDGRPAVDVAQYLGLAVHELMRPALITAPGVRIMRARGRNRPTQEQQS